MKNSQVISEPTWDPFEPPTDPYPVYRAMRDEMPVYHHPLRSFWALSRFDDVQRANRDWQTYSYAQGVDIDNVGEYLKPGNFLGEDPPLHSMLRGVVKDRSA